jgi:hypothetical protein
MAERESPAELVAEASGDDTRSFVWRVKRAIQRKFSPEEKVRIVLEGVRPNIQTSQLTRWDRAPEKPAEPSAIRTYD